MCLQNLCEIWIFAREGSRARHPTLLYSFLLISLLFSTLRCFTLLYSTLLLPTDLSTLLFSTVLYSFLLFPSLLYASVNTSILQADSFLFSSVYSLFYCSLFCVSQTMKRPAFPSLSIASKNVCPKRMCPCKVLEISMPHATASCSKNDMYAMDFATAHRVQHRKTTGSQATTLSQ